MHCQVMFNIAIADRSALFRSEAYAVLAPCEICENWKKLVNKASVAMIECRYLVEKFSPQLNKERNNQDARRMRMRTSLLIRILV